MLHFDILNKCLNPIYHLVRIENRLLFASRQDSKDSYSHLFSDAAFSPLMRPKATNSAIFPPI